MSALISLEIAFGADLTASSSTWGWVDVTTDMRATPGISTGLGRGDESSQSNPANFSVVLTNEDGDYSQGGRSIWWPYIRRNTPVRLCIDPDDGGGKRVVFQGGADGWTPGWESLTGDAKVAVVTLSASGTLRRLSQGKTPIRSAYRRFAESDSTTVRSYWPMEEGKLTTTSVAVRGGGNLLIEGSPNWEASTDFYCSEALPAMKASRLTAFPAPYVSTGENQVRALMRLPEDVADVPNGAFLMSTFMTGGATIARWDIVYTNSPGLEIRATRTDGTEVLRINTGFVLQAKLTRLTLALDQNGSDIDWTLGATSVGDTVAGFTDGTLATHTVGTVSWVQLGATLQLGDTVFGHLTVENGITSLLEATGPLNAFQDEYASSGGVGRLERLCSENDVALDRHTSSIGTDGLDSFDTMGPQLPLPLLDLLHECEAADDGQLWDGRSGGLSYTTRRYRELGTVALTIDAAAGQLAGDFAPVDDDQRTRNKVEVKRTFGSSDSYEDTDGPMGTGVIGTYDESVTINIARDGDALQQAQWRVSGGTIEGYRYPKVSVDLRKSPELAAAVLDLIPGDRIDVTNLDDALGQFSASSVSLIVEGIAHMITPKAWVATFTCSPFESVGVGRVATETGDTSDMLMRLDSDGSTVTTQAEAGATGLIVTSTVALWSTTADDYPFTLDVGGLPVRATACSGGSNPQTFTVDPLPAPIHPGTPVALWQPRRLGMG